MTDADFKCIICGAWYDDDFIESEANKSGRTKPEVIAEFRLAGCLALSIRHKGYTGGMERAGLPV